MSGIGKPTIANVKIVKLSPLSSSRNGNPRWRVTLDMGAVLITQTDAMIGYGIDNPEMRGQVDIWTSRAGRITHVAPTGGKP